MINALKANGTEPYPVTKSSVQKDTISQCNICDFEAASSITLRKHMNTKHPDARAETKHTKKSADKRLECSLCQDELPTSEELNNHIEEHLEEIRDIDVEDLKSGHEEFECCQCDFKSNDNDQVKNHLSIHALEPYRKSKRVYK